MNLRRLIAPFFGLTGVALIPWTIWLTTALPSRHEATDWQLIWGGFDLALATALILTAVAALRRSPWLEAMAAASGTLLLTDAWFDVTLEAGNKHFTAAVLQAVFAEIPLALICFWVARDAERALATAMPTSPAGPTVPDPKSPRPRIPDPRRQEDHSQVA